MKLFLTSCLKRIKTVTIVLGLLVFGYSGTLKAQLPHLKYEQYGIANDSVVWHITGKVTDQKNGNGLGNCTVYFRTTDLKTVIAKVTSNADGTFECNLTCLKNQPVNVLFRKSNFLPVELASFYPSSGKLELRLTRDPKASTWKPFKPDGCPSF